MLFINNKYSNWYHKIIANAKSRNLPKDTYAEKHHIIPRSLGGNDTKENLVLLTSREHFVCHLLLVKMTKDNFKHKMLAAVTRFQQARSYQYRALNSWEYKKLRECANLARKGIKHTEEARKKIRDKHHNVSGPNNPRAKFIKAISPNGTEYVIHGGLKKFCKENGLGYSTVHVILSTNKKFNGSTEGWAFSYI